MHTKVCILLICGFLLFGCTQTEKQIMPNLNQDAPKNPFDSQPKPGDNEPVNNTSEPTVFYPLSRDYFGLSAQQTTANVTSAIGPQRVGVILFQIPDAPKVERTATEISDDIFDLTNPCSFNYFLMQSSYGKTWLANSGVTPWLTIQLPYGMVSANDEVITPADPYLDYSKIDRLFIIGAEENASHAINPSEQTFTTNEGTQRVVVTRADYDTLGFSYSICGQLRVRGYSVLAHEYAHSLTPDGIPHSGLLLCGEKPLVLNGRELSDDCSVDIDLLDQLGVGLGHYNAIIKEKLGWLSQSQVIVVEQSGTYTLHPIESQNQTTVVLKIPRVNCSITGNDLDACGGDGTGWYYLEYHRLPVSINDIWNTSGIQIRIDGFLGNKNRKSDVVFGSDYLVSNLLKIVPETERQTERYALNTNETFIDPFNGTKITPLNITNQEAQIQIEYHAPA